MLLLIFWKISLLFNLSCKLQDGKGSTQTGSTSAFLLLLLLTPGVNFFAGLPLEFNGFNSAPSHPPSMLGKLWGPEPQHCLNVKLSLQDELLLRTESQSMTEEYKEIFWILPWVTPLQGQNRREKSKMNFVVWMVAPQINRNAAESSIFHGNLLESRGTEEKGNF